MPKIQAPASVRPHTIDPDFPCHALIVWLQNFEVEEAERVSSVDEAGIFNLPKATLRKLGSKKSSKLGGRGTCPRDV
jgi:hypothetical protein